MLLCRDQEEFQDLDVVGYGKNTQMFYNPNNPVVTGVGLPIMKESNDLPTKPKQASSNGSTPKIGPVGFDPLPKKGDSSDSDAFYDKDSVEGVKIRSDSTTSGGRDRAGTVPESPHSGNKVILPDTMEKPEKEKKKKKKKKEKQVPENDYVSNNPMPTPQYQPPSSHQTGGHSRPKRPELKPEAPPAPKANITPVPTPPQHTPQLAHPTYQPQPQPQPQPVYPQPQTLQRLQHDPGTVSDSSGSQGFHQQDLEQFYRQKEAESQWLNEQNRPKAKKARPYRYPTADPNRSNTMSSQGGYRR